MAALEQREHIEKLLEREEKQQKRAASIQKHYESYVSSGDGGAFERLLTELDAYCIAWVRKQLWKVDLYSDETEHNALQESRLAVWNAAEADRQSGEARENFTYYAFGMYKHKTTDIIRKLSSARKNGKQVSLDEPADDSGRSLGDMLPGGESADRVEKREKEGTFRRLFELYVGCLLDSPAYPPRSLALCYARVIPHLIGAIPDTKAASAKWAFERMGNGTVGALGDDSEKFLKENIKNSLRWGEEFCRLLMERAEENPSVLLRDVVYTEAYDRRKLEDWAEYMQKSVMRDAVEKLAADRSLLYLAKEYLSGSSMLRLLETGGKGR